MTRALLVDFDGTLADTRIANYSAYAAALQEVGVAVSRERFDAVAFGKNWREFLPLLMQEAGVSANPADVAQRKATMYREAASAILFNDALVRLLAASAPEVKLALVTSASRTNLMSALSTRPDVLALFDLIITGDDVEKHKPHPECYFKAAQTLGVAPGDCVVIEDSDVGVAAGQAFGAQVLRITL